MKCVCVAPRAEGQAGRIYGATLGTLENVSLLWEQTARRAGLNEQTFVHGLGDGAPWIVQQFKDKFLVPRQISDRFLSRQ